MKNEILASRIIANTRRQKRALNLVQIAEDIKRLNDTLGSTKAVARMVLLSESMVGQFLGIFNLCPEVKKLVETREIDSVSNAFYVSKFNSNNQKVLAELLISERINSSELRLILPLRKILKELNVPELELLSLENQEYTA